MSHNSPWSHVFAMCDVVFGRCDVADVFRQHRRRCRLTLLRCRTSGGRRRRGDVAMSSDVVRRPPPTLGTRAMSLSTPAMSPSRWALPLRRDDVARHPSDIANVVLSGRSGLAMSPASWATSPRRPGGQRLSDVAMSSDVPHVAASLTRSFSFLVSVLDS